MIAVSETASAPRFSVKSLPVYIGIGISVILIIVLLVTFFSGKDARDSAVEQYIKGSYMYDAHAVGQLAPDEVWTWVAQNGGTAKPETTAYLEENAFIYAEDMYGKYGTDINFSHDITDDEDLAEDRIKTICDTYGIKLTSVDEAQTLTVDITIEGNLKTAEDTLTLTYLELDDGNGYIVEAFPFLSRITPAEVAE